jgi:hypothetical protein
MRHSQNVGQCIHTDLSIRSRCFGHVSRCAGHRPLPSDNLKIAASADRFVRAIGAPLRERRLK